VAAAIFLGALLLFQVQPMIARYILPWFGGSPSVWTTCMLFFQVGLFAGYAYAHGLATYLTPRRQVIVHLALLFAALLSLPITPDPASRPESSGDPSIAILGLLLRTVGVPYVALAASAPLLQRWFSHATPGRSPYRLYALSNLGSLLGLLSYPFVIEPRLALGTQTIAWSTGFGLYTLLCIVSASPLLRTRQVDPAPACPTRAVENSESDRGLWMALPACATTVLLATTNQMCQDFAVIPFLWVLPLSFYLLSFILCFGDDRWYFRPVWLSLMVLCVAALVSLLLKDYADEEMAFPYQIAIYIAAMFSCCMVCHGELVRRRPPPERLTSFYLMIALGGAAGGVFVSFIAPRIFDGYWELHASLVASLLLGGVCALVGRGAVGSPVRRFGGLLLWSGGVGVLALLLWRHVELRRQDTIVMVRGFYGVLSVVEAGAGTSSQYSLYHGRINHGLELRSPGAERLPTTYYGTRSGIGAALLFHPRRALDGATHSLKVGVVGLGIGTIASYASGDDLFRFYEINDQVRDIARDYFTYISDGSGRKEVVLGDGRISLARELREGGSRQYDVLAVDAFSGDSIPVHLLTREAFDLYWEHLKADGILAVHVTNLHLDLKDVVRSQADRLGKEAIWFDDMTETNYSMISDWVLMTSNPQFLNDPRVAALMRRWERPRVSRAAWTDDYSNLLELIR
jgi:spermidine synthase